MKPNDHSTKLSKGVTDTLYKVKSFSRISLGLVWLYEGLVPKILFLNSHPEQIDLVRWSRIYWPTPKFTLIALGVAQVIAGLVLIIGWEERKAVTLVTLWMFVLMILVAAGRPPMLTDPFGALAKDACLVACAVTVRELASMISDPATPLPC